MESNPPPLQTPEEALRFQARLLDAVEQAVIASDMHGTVTYWNRYATHLYGWSAEEAVGRNLMELLVPELSAEQGLEIMERLRQGESWTGEFTVKRRDGSTFPVSVSDTPIHDEAGALVGVIGVSKDISERRRREESLARTAARDRFLVELSDALRPLSDPREIQAAATRLLGQQLKVDRTLYAEIEPDDEHFFIADNYVRGSFPKMTGRFPLKDFGKTPDSQRAGKVLLLPDIAAAGEADEHLASYLAAGVRSIIGVPLNKDGRWVASLTVHHGSPRQWTAEDAALVSETAERTWAAVERARAEEALRESQERFRLMADTVPQMVWMTDAEGRVEYLNKWWADYTGAPADEVRAADIAERYLHPDDAPQVLEAFNRAIRSGQGFEVEQRNRSASGEYRWFLNRAQPYRDTRSGEILKWFGIGVDIHDRKQAEAELRKAEENLRLIMESVRDYAIYTLDLEGRVTNWNAGAETVFGFTAAEMMGQATDCVFTPEDRAAGVPQTEMESALKYGRAADERWHMRKDGSRFYASGVMNTLHNGHVQGFVKVARDLTERKQADEALQEAEERQRIVLEAAQLGTWDWDIAANSIRWNGQHYALVGLPPSEEPRSYEDFAACVHPDDLPPVAAKLAAAVEGEEIYSADFRVIRADTGAVRWMSGYGKAMNRDAAGRATRMTGVMYDITSRKEIEQRKDEFLAVASHELKTPITSIKAYAEVLRDMFDERGGEEESTALLQKLDDQIDRLTRLIHDLLEATRLNEGRLELNIAQMDLNALLRSCAEESQRTTSHRLELKLAGLPPVQADREKMVQVVSNLLSNAIKYSPPGKRIIISSRQFEDGYVRVCVQDFGVGLSENAAPRVFERFFRAPDPRVRTFPGMGLGLYISAELVRLHGGRLWVEKSERGKGSTFCFTLPVEH